MDKGALGEGQAQALGRLAEGEANRAECVRLARKAVAHGLSVAEVKARGLFRLQGKEYIVQDGDILNIRFNV